MSFLAPSAPKVEPLPVTPTRNDAEVRQAAADERARARLRKGRAATILTSGQGVTGAAPVTKKQALGE